MFKSTNKGVYIAKNLTISSAWIRIIRQTCNFGSDSWIPDYTNHFLWVGLGQRDQKNNNMLRHCWFQPNTKTIPGLNLSRGKQLEPALLL